MDQFAQVVGNFADAVTSNFKLPVPAQPEDQLKEPVGKLIRETGNLTELKVDWRTEVHPADVDGRPDLGVTVNELLTGHVEIKHPGMGARPETFTGRNRSQWEKFKALPNLIYTDGGEWSLYRSGELKSRARISADVSEGGSKALNLDSLNTLHQLLRDFLYWQPIVPGTAEGLANFLAPLARVLRDDVAAALERQAGPLRTLANEWSGLLFPEGDDAQFADAYAQTVTYALLLARFEGAESLRPAIAVDALQREHGLLAEALQLLEVQVVREELRMPIELLERAIEAVDSVKLGQASDPWLYFYEQFLGAYDPKLRRDRGVYYTPVEVVRAQVTLAGELLKTRFGKPLAFADDDVVVLDPAVGTGTYPLAVLDHASCAVQKRLGLGAVPEKLTDLAGRLYAFELLVGPYSVAHLRLSQSLKNSGVTGKAPRVYLTDTLESPNYPPPFTSLLLQAQLTEERQRALDVKKDVRVFVCLGNPPYDREEQDPNEPAGQRKGGWVRYGDDQQGIPLTTPILEDFLAPAKEAGAGVHLKNLYNDYVYFWRWALWKVLDSTGDAGIVTFITASSYLRGPGFGGMRQKMREVFDELWIIDLEGSSLGTRKTDNVFAIRTPVAIAIGVRNGPPQPESPAKVWKTRIIGTEREKLAALNAVASITDLDWRECTKEWSAPFFPAETGAFSAWPMVTDVFPWQQSGTKTGRAWPIGPDQQLLERRWRELAAANPTNRRSLFVDRPTGRKATDSPPPLPPATAKPRSVHEMGSSAEVPQIVRYSYRSFDRQHVIADARLIDRPGPPLWATRGHKQVYIAGLLTETLGSGPGAMATAEIPDLHHFRGSFGGKDVIPLWRDVDGTQPNVTAGLLAALADAYERSVSAEKLFAYTYGILAQPAYVQRFWDELEIPPPRLPITKDAELFRRVAEHGRRLVYLHTYSERLGGPDDDGSVPQGEARCTSAVSSEQYPKDFSYDPAAGILRVGNGEFSPVTPQVWDYSVSGMQVVKSWLGRRKRDGSGRKSSPLDDIRPERWEFTEELLELLWVLEATLALQPEGAALLDEVLSSQLFTKDELPTPSDEEREPPRTAVDDKQQLEFPAEAD